MAEQFVLYFDFKKHNKEERIFMGNRLHSLVFLQAECIHQKRQRMVNYNAYFAYALPNMQND